MNCAEAFISSQDEDLWVLSTGVNVLDPQSCYRGQWVDSDFVDPNTEASVRDYYARVKAIKQALLAMAPTQDDNRQAVDDFERLWKDIQDDMPEQLVSQFKTRFEDLFRDLLPTISTESLTSILLGSNFVRASDSMEPFMSLLKNKLIATKGRVFFSTFPLTSNKVQIWVGDFLWELD